MHIIADLQLHSKYSRAVSPNMNLLGISEWALKKGIGLVATGDWTHPLYFKEITANLVETSPGIYALKTQKNSVSFLLSTEISSIYTQGGKQRRIHNLIFSPSITTCERIIQELKRRGANLMSDGRPIIGISSKDLLELCLGIDTNILFIPAHVWTPWFSIFGSKSGFNSIEECFGDLSSHIYAIETGLSSDPLMNWQIKELDHRSIVSFSDAHSGPKLGREATVFITRNESQTANNKFTYQDIAQAIKQHPLSQLKIGYTIEFFPEEGKYHWDGHRACGIKYSPKETKEKGLICPKCRQPLTIGVEWQVNKLSSCTITRNDLLFLQNKVGLTFVYDKEKKRVPFVSLIPLPEILLEVYNHSQTKAFQEYERLTSLFSTEFDILLKKPYSEIESFGGKKLQEAIQIVRERNVSVDPGFDGVFGVVKIFNNNVANTPKEEKKQLDLFS